MSELSRIIFKNLKTASFYLRATVSDLLKPSRNENPHSTLTRKKSDATYFGLILLRKKNRTGIRRSQSFLIISIIRSILSLPDRPPYSPDQSRGPPHANQNRYRHDRKVCLYPLRCKHHRRSSALFRSLHRPSQPCDRMSA